MASDNELTRLADMAAALRPEWPARSVRAHLRAHHADRAYADLAVALAALATDPDTKTPARLAEHGHWWLATRFLAGRSEVPEVGPGRHQEPCARPGHEHEPQRTCRLCRAEDLAGTEPTTPAPAIPTPGVRELAAHLATIAAS